MRDDVIDWGSPKPTRTPDYPAKKGQHSLPGPSQTYLLLVLLTIFKDVTRRSPYSLFASAD